MARFSLVAILFSVISTLALSSGCDVDDVAVYKVKLTTLWSEERFPKDYPLNRPKAQWSQMFGVSHNSTYRLYHVGEVAGASVRHYSQYGDLGQVVSDAGDAEGTYDMFSAPAIGAGEGSSENVVLVDGGHSLVSMVCRMVPSPDWFVGVDSVDLCVDSTWIDEITLDLEPLDGGAESGLTFTAPHWAREPPGAVTRLGPRAPHPAAGFYYPHLARLPAIAKLHITKEKEYTAKDMKDLARREVMKKLFAKDQYKGLPQKRAGSQQERLSTEEDITTKNYVEELKNLEEDPVGTPEPNNPDNIVQVVTQKTTTTSNTTTAPPMSGEWGALSSADAVVLALAGGRLAPRAHLPRHFRSRLHNAVNRIRDNDCLVSEWGPWSACSVTCGFGEMFRERRVVRAPRDDGRDCPALRDRRHCGEVNSCYHVDYFQW